MVEEKGTKPMRSKFQKHLNILVWKAYLQRLRRWHLLVVEMVFAALLFFVAILVAKPVFLTPLEDQPEAPLTFRDILQSLHPDTILGFAPDISPFSQIMDRVSELLSTEFLSAPNENGLNLILYNRSKGTKILNKVIWVLWTEKDEKPIYQISIKSTEVATKSAAEDPTTPSKRPPNPYLQSGFLAVQVAVSQAILEYNNAAGHEYELSLVSMPVSPLMDRGAVKRVISIILMCFTLAFLPPVLETEALVVIETEKRFKRALRIRNVDYSTMYFGWLSFGMLTAGPVCLIGSIALILIFRWVQLLTVQIILLTYFCLMMMLALIMAMFHSHARISCVWSILQTLLQTLMAELMVHHRFDEQNTFITFIIQMFLPPFGLLNVLNKYAFIQTERDLSHANSLLFTLLSWCALIFIYFQILMLLQRTIGSGRAIGGQMSWKSIIFKRAEDPHKLHPVVRPTGLEWNKLQKVDELVAKAISFRDVTKHIMGIPVLHRVTFDIYRGEFSLLFAERIQQDMMITVEDLLTGLTHPDSGHINVLGVNLTPGRSLMTEPVMMGYCDCSSYLIEDLTVEEHLLLYTQICLWNESSNTILGYGLLRTQRLIEECDLSGLLQTRVSRLGVYYRAQLCWAIAILLEPRIVVVPDCNESPLHMAVIKDKIVQYKKYVTIVKITLSSIELEFADRLILLDTKVLAFGGTPAYMFFTFGREYRLRLSLRNTNDQTDVLLKRVEQLGAHVRAHLGSLLILRMRTSPSSNVLALITHVHNNRDFYGLISMNVSLPDPEEVFKRALHESRAITMAETRESIAKSKEAIENILAPRPWTRKKTKCFHMLHLRIVAWKYVTFYIHYRFFLIVTLITAMLSGVFLGLSLGNTLKDLEDDSKILKLLHNTMTVEKANAKNTLILRLEDTEQARAFAKGYVMSDTNAEKAAVEKLSYIALDSSESLTEYLVTQAIDKPQQYVNEYAYGMDVYYKKNVINIRALYSPLHEDWGTAPRSVARVYMTLLRHYTNNLEATIRFTDNPLIVDLTPWMTTSSELTLLIQFLLVFTISHMTLIPSREFGLVRHMQSHAYNFSPARYWLMLAACDLIHYWLLVVIMSLVTLAIMWLIVPRTHFHYADFVAVPFMLIVYGMACVPQAYLFSLGPRTALNSMALVIINIVFGEATLIAKVFYGNVYNYAVSFMALSPQFNMAFALVKIRQIFLYNSECIIFKYKKLCVRKALHKCCRKCGVLQQCFERKSYFSSIMTEVVSILVTAAIFMTILLLWEYRVISLLWHTVLDRLKYSKQYPPAMEMPGAARERVDVMAKERQLKMTKEFQHLKLDTFGENLLAVNVSRVEQYYYVLRNLYFGLGKGEILALSGMKRHGRVALCETLAGYKTRSEGHLWAMSKYRLKYSPHNYSTKVAICCERNPLPDWMTVYDGLEMIAILRGVPKKHVRTEISNYINALDLWHQQDLLVCRLRPSEQRRLNFAAAVVGAPPVLILDESSAYQNYSVRRAMYRIVYALRKKGHAIIHSAYSMESHLPVASRLAILRDGRIFDIDYVDKLRERYSKKGLTVVVHLKDDVNVMRMFHAYFEEVTINDTSDVLVNLQILDDLSWPEVFSKMELLKAENEQVYSYIICAKPIDYVYNTIISEEEGFKPAGDLLSRPCLQRLIKINPKLEPPPEVIKNLRYIEKKYDITTLTELPWSVIFHR